MGDGIRSLADLLGGLRRTTPATSRMPGGTRSRRSPPGSGDVVDSFPCPGHGDGDALRPCSGIVPVYRTSRGYLATGACSLEREYRTADRLESCFGLGDPSVCDEVFEALKVPLVRFAAGQDARGRINASAVDACSAVPRGRTGVWLIGHVGSGKSFLAWHTLSRLVTEDGMRGVYVTEGMLREAWRVYSRTGGEDVWAGRLLRAVGWPKPEGMAQAILLDEFGSLRDMTQAAHDLLDHVVHTAHAAGRHLLVTSNRAGQQLLDERGDRIVSRLRDICGAPISLAGDWRAASSAAIAAGGRKG